MIVYGILHILSLFLKYPGFLNYLFDTNKILGIFIFLPEKIREPLSKIIIGSCSIALGVFIFIILNRTP